MMRRSKQFAFSLACLTLACVLTSVVQGDEKNGYLQLGEPGNAALKDIKVFFSGTFRGGVVTGGVGLRGTGSGTIAIGGIPAGSKVFKAFLYWDTLDNALPTNIAKINGKPATGRLIGKDASPCWQESSNFAFRADVTSLVAGNGNYLIEIPDSGDFNVGPSVDGASLVVVFTNPTSPVTSIKILDGDDLIEGSSRTNVIPRTPRRGGVVGQAKLTFIVADGQAFEDPIHSTAFCNGTPVSGDKAFNASDGMLWDDITYDVTDLVDANSKSVTAGVSTDVDCLVWIAAVYTERLSHHICAPGKVDIWVDAANAANEVSPYATRGTAASTITKALAVAKPGSVIFVLRGTYAEPDTLHIGPELAGITLAGDTRGNCIQPTIDGQNNQRVIDIVKANNVMICGFNIVNGKGTGFFPRGGGIRMDFSKNISLKHCCFDSNTALSSFGGAVYATTSSGFVGNCLFQNNTAEAAGGAMAIKGLVTGGFQGWSLRDCQFVDNATTDGPGGAIAVFGTFENLRAGTFSGVGGAPVDLKSCSFLRNKATGPEETNGDGGAFYCEGSKSIVAMTDPTFVENQSERGGALAAGGISTVTLTGHAIKFQNNSAPDAGACYATTLGKIEIVPDNKVRAMFSGNRATSTSRFRSGFGGAFHITCGGIAVLNQCDFADNVAVLDGGAIDAREARADLIDCNFLDSGNGVINQAVQGDGGAIALRSVASGGGFLESPSGIRKPLAFRRRSVQSWDAELPKG